MNGKPTATGTLTSTDVDNAPNTFTAVSTPTASAGGYGTFTMTADGMWTYTLNDNQQRGAGAQCLRHARPTPSRSQPSTAPPRW